MINKTRSKYQSVNKVKFVLSQIVDMGKKYISGSEDSTLPPLHRFVVWIGIAVYCLLFWFIIVYFIKYLLSLV